MTEELKKWIIDKTFSEFDETYFKRCENNSVYFDQRLKKLLRRKILAY